MLKTDTTHTLPVTAGFITGPRTFVNLDGARWMGNKTICHGYLFTHAAAAQVLQWKNYLFFHAVHNLSPATFSKERGCDADQTK